MGTNDWTEREAEFRTARDEPSWVKLAELDATRAAELVRKEFPGSMGSLIFRRGLQWAEGALATDAAAAAFADSIVDTLAGWDGSADSESGAAARSLAVFADSLSVTGTRPVILHRLLSAYAAVVERKGGDRAIKRFAAKAPFHQARVELPAGSFSAEEAAWLAKLGPVFGYQNFREIPVEQFEAAAAVLSQAEASPRVSFQALRAMWRIDAVRALPLLIARLRAHPEEIGSLGQWQPFRDHDLEEPHRATLRAAKLEALLALLERFDGSAGPPTGLYPGPKLPLLQWSLQVVQWAAIPPDGAARLEAALQRIIALPKADAKTVKRASELLGERSA
ncbi:MAG: hypothetical protein QM723_26880 [Myxococcaceae bacterium]